jgi:hypothetical protein
VTARPPSSRGGDGGAAVDRGNGRDDGQAESGAVMGCAVAEPLERLEDAAGVGRADDRADVATITCISPIRA